MRVVYLQSQLLHPHNDRALLSSEVVGDVYHGFSVSPHLSEFFVGFFRPWVKGVGMLLSARVDGVDRFSDQLLVGFEVFFQSFDILVAQIGETADVHVVCEVVDFDCCCQ